MRVQYFMVLFMVTEARKTSKKEAEPESELTVPSDERYYRVPFGSISLEGFNPSLKGPLDFDNLYFRFLQLYNSTDKPDLIPFVPNNENDSKVNRRNMKRIKKKRDHGNKAFGMTPSRSGKSQDDLPEGPGDNDDETKTMKGGKDVSKINRVGGVYLDFTRNFMSSIGQSFRQGQSFAHGSLPDRTESRSAISPEPSEVPRDMGPDKYYPERRLAQEPHNSHLPPNLRNRLVDDSDLYWTTCEEFGRDAVFYPKDIINIEWVPFFIWTTSNFVVDSIVHTFEYPTIKLVQKYRKTASLLLKKKLDWDAPKLLMKLKTLGSHHNMLLIAADRKGKFDGLTYIKVPEGAQHLTNVMPYPVMSLHLKSLGSYLAMMTCDDKRAIIMAPAGSEPKSYEAARRGAAFLKFNGTGYVIRRDLEKERLFNQDQINIEARQRELEEGRTMVPPRSIQAFFPFNREPPIDMF